MIGSRFDRWTVVDLAPGRPKHVTCACSCGTRRQVYRHALRSGRSRSCGCLKRDLASIRNRRHGATSGGIWSHLYRVWAGMKGRCHTPSSKSFPYYGGRGIEVCPEWRASFERFRRWAIASEYQEPLEIDRIDTNGNYEPNNCRWVTRLQNANNKRSARLVDAFGETRTVSQWSRDPRCTVHYNTLLQRLNYGWSSERAISAVAGGRPIRSSYHTSQLRL